MYIFVIIDPQIDNPRKSHVFLNASSTHDPYINESIKIEISMLRSTVEL